MTMGAMSRAALRGAGQAPFSYEEIPDLKARDGVHYRIRDAADNRIATSYLREHAELIVRLMNLGARVPG